MQGAREARQLSRGCLLGLGVYGGTEGGGDARTAQALLLLSAGLTTQLRPPPGPQPRPLSRQDANSIVCPGGIRSSKLPREPLKVSSAIADKLITEAFLSHAARATSHVPAPTVSCPGPDSGCHPRGCHPRWMRHGVPKRTPRGRRRRRIRSPASQVTAWLSPRSLQVLQEHCVHTLLQANRVPTAKPRPVCCAHHLLWAHAHFPHCGLPALRPTSPRRECVGALRRSCQRRISRIRHIRDLHSHRPEYGQALGPANRGNAARYGLRNFRGRDTRTTLIIFPQSGA